MVHSTVDAKLATLRFGNFFQTLGKLAYFSNFQLLCEKLVPDFEAFENK